MVNIIGAGLAGVEAAYYLAQNGIKVTLYEMRPVKMTLAHKTALFAELVCSNSFRSNDPFNAVGLLKTELERFNSLVIKAAHATSVPAGSSLAVDRELFSNYITDVIKNHPNIKVVNQEVTTINKDELTIIAAGPLASDKLFSFLKETFTGDNLHFFDAVAPIIAKDSIDFSKAYYKSRYDKGEASYINCPMNKEQYYEFYEQLINAKRVIPKDFENKVFEGCMPVEDMASRGDKTLLFGPLKPVGLEHEGNYPYAVVQLRQDDVNATMYNMVGFQTHLTFGEQDRIIKMIPGLEKAQILRYGVIHRNTYLESPKYLNSSYQVKSVPNWFFAGQISGVEGYIESAASGLCAAVNVLSLINNQKLKPFPKDTMIGAMANYISSPNSNFVPMNANFGLFDPLNIKVKKKLRKEAYYHRACDALDKFLEGEFNG